MRTAEKERTEKKSKKLLKKWLQVSGRRQACTKKPNRPRKGQSGKVSSKVGVNRKSKTKKRRKRKIGRSRTRWRCNW